MTDMHKAEAGGTAECANHGVSKAVQTGIPCGQCLIYRISG